MWTNVMNKQRRVALILEFIAYFINIMYWGYLFPLGGYEKFKQHLGIVAQI